jgi:serine/threonine protein kinase
MNDTRSTVGEPLPPSVLRRLDALCERFEDAWQVGQRPRIDDYLSEAEEPERDRLLRELIALDIDYRRQLGEKPEAHDYHQWLPSLDERWLERLTGANRYELVGQIGRGGMGTVLQGYDRHLRRDLAVKMLRPEHQDQPHMVRRFLREAWIGARLQHPGILPVYDLGEFADRQPFFTMKLVRGRTLEAPWPTITSASSFRTWADGTRQSRNITRPSNPIPIWPWPTTTSAIPCGTRNRSTRLSANTRRPSA